MRRVFPIRLGAVRENLEEVGFYSILAGSLLSEVRAAIGSCLSPQRRDSTREIADFLESILGRFRDILFAHDQLGRLNQLEKYGDATNGTLLAQMYHFDHALVLMTGCLNAAAWIIAVLGEASSNPQAVSWTSLNAGASWTKQLVGTDAQSMSEKARGHAFRNLGTVIQKMRDAYQHRDALRAGILTLVKGETWDSSLDADALHVGSIDLSSTVSRAPTVPSTTGGLLRTHGYEFLLPYQFLRHSLIGMAAYLNDVIGAASWPHSYDWYEDDAFMAEERRRVWGFGDDARWLFGPTG